jgi:uncharacterized protein HemX
MENFWNLAANQGFSVLLLSIGLYYFLQKQKLLEAKMDEMQQKRESLMEKIFTLSEETKNIINQNTEMLKILENYVRSKTK